jgi:hypothetical protein
LKPARAYIVRPHIKERRKGRKEKKKKGRKEGRKEIFEILYSLESCVSCF